MSLKFKFDFGPRKKAPEPWQARRFSIAQPLKNVVQNFIELIGCLGRHRMCLYCHLADNAFHAGPSLANNTSKSDQRLFRNFRRLFASCR
jgi:hypothetical protein